MRTFGALVILGLSIVGPASASEDVADLLLHHGVLYTVEHGRVEGSIAVRGGRIVYVGPDAGAEPLRGPRTRVIELAGRAVVPGLIDSHSHLAELGRVASEVDLRSAASFAEVVRRVAEAARRAPAGAWVRGFGWDQTRWPGHQFPTHDELSAAVPDHPVWLSRVDGHAALLNRRAMDALGISTATADPAGGRYLRDARGVPTGVLIDNAKDEAERRLPEPSAAELRQRIVRGAEICLAVGLTTVTDMGVDGETLAAYADLRQRGELPIRVAAFVADAPRLLDEWMARGPRLDPEARFEVRGVKLYADGALGSRGAALLEPYSDDPANLGLQVSTEDHMAEVAKRALGAGFQVGIHAIGDRGALLALDAMESALGGPRPDARFRLEHAQVMRLQDIARLASLGIIAAMQPTHATSDMRWAEERVGPRRLEGAYAWRRMLDAGVRLALGSDFPVESPDPRLGLYAAVSRQDLAGNPPGGWRFDQKLSREEALRGFTLDAAYSVFWERELGSIVVGKRADLVVFGRDPMAIAEREMPQAEVDYTILDGRIVHSREGAR